MSGIFVVLEQDQLLFMSICTDFQGVASFLAWQQQLSVLTERFCITEWKGDRVYIFEPFLNFSCLCHWFCRILFSLLFFYSRMLLLFFYVVNLFICGVQCLDIYWWLYAISRILMLKELTIFGMFHATVFGFLNETKLFRLDKSLIAASILIFCIHIYFCYHWCSVFAV